MPRESIRYNIDELIVQPRDFPDGHKIEVRQSLFVRENERHFLLESVSVDDPEGLRTLHHYDHGRERLSEVSTGSSDEIRELREGIFAFIQPKQPTGSFPPATRKDPEW